MNICLLADGSSIHTVRWLNAFAKKGHKVSLITMQQANINEINEQVNIYVLKYKNKLGYYLNSLEVKLLLFRIKPDILNVHYASGYGTLGRLVGFKPTLLSVWGSDVYIYPYKNKWNEKILRRNLKAATKLASTSYAMKKQTSLFLKFGEEIEVTPFGIDTNLFMSNNQKKYENEIIIGTVKKLEEVYGIDILIKAVAELVSQLDRDGHESIVKKIKLQIVGDGSERENLISLASSLGIEKFTEFVGEVPYNKVPDFLNKFDVYCAFSRSESFGVAILEASSCEIPVIVNNVGGLPEVVKDNVTGYIVNNNNMATIVEKLYSLVIDKDKRIEMGSNGRKFVSKEYEWENSILHMLKVFQSIVKTNEGVRK